MKYVHPKWRTVTLYLTISLTLAFFAGVFALSGSALLAFIEAVAAIAWGYNAGQASMEK